MTTMYHPEMCITIIPFLNGIHVMTTVYHSEVCKTIVPSIHDLTYIPDFAILLSILSITLLLISFIPFKFIKLSFHVTKLGIAYVLNNAALV